MESADFILGPQLPLGNTWFDQTQVSRGKTLGRDFPATPPPPEQSDPYINAHYYDLGQAMYIAYARTQDPEFLTLARKVEDSWWLAYFTKGGALRRFDVEGTSPKFSGVVGLILRALDGRPELWDWINAYTRYSLDLWVMMRLNDPQLYLGIREDAFSLEFATILAKVLPDSFPLQAGGTETNGAAIRAKYLADVETAVIKYFERLQYPDGSWRWDDPYYAEKTTAKLASDAAASATALSVEPLRFGVQADQKVSFASGADTTTTTAQASAGANQIKVSPLTVARRAGDELYIADGQLRGIMQPFRVGMLLRALIAVHKLTTHETVKTSIQNQITRACRHLYLDGPYSRQQTSVGTLRGFHYFYHGGSTLNPTKYEKGDLVNWDTNNKSDIQNTRQQIATLVAAYGWCFKQTGDSFFKTAGDELWDSAYGETDGIKNYMTGDGKSYNQNACFAPRYLAWAGAPATPQPAPSPTPTPPAPTPPSTPSPDGTKASSIVDSQGAKWTIQSSDPTKAGPTLKNGAQVGGGIGFIYKYLSSVVYTLGTDSNWYKWTGSSWMGIGAQEPGGTAPAPSPTPTPSPTPPAPTPTIRKLAQPSTEAKWNTLLAQQKAEGYYLTKFLTGSWVQFEKI